MEEREKAFVIASIKLKLEDDKKKEKEMKRRTSKGKKGRR
jgi:hypothetical protein